MVTRSELESMRQELRELSKERAQLRTVQEKGLDDFHREWKEKLSYVKIVATDRIKPFKVDKDRAYDKAQASLVTRLNKLEREKKEAIAAAEQDFKEGRKEAISTCQEEIESANEDFNVHAKVLAEGYKSDVVGCEAERDAALVTLKEGHKKEVEALEEKAAELQKQMSVAGAA